MLKYQSVVDDTCTDQDWFLFGALQMSGQKLPFMFIDFDYINKTNIWENRNVVRAQIAQDGDVTVSNTYGISEAIDNNGMKVGAFLCDNQKSGTIHNTPDAAANLPMLTFNEFTLEVIVKPTVNNVTFYGYIIGIEGTDDNIKGDSISYNQIYNHTSPQKNKFFLLTLQMKDGWHR